MLAVKVGPIPFFNSCSLSLLITSPDTDASRNYEASDSSHCRHTSHSKGRGGSHEVPLQLSCHKRTRNSDSEESDNSSSNTLESEDDGPMGPEDEDLVRLNKGALQDSLHDEVSFRNISSKKPSNTVFLRLLHGVTISQQGQANTPQAKWLVKTIDPTTMTVTRLTIIMVLSTALTTWTSLVAMLMGVPTSMTILAILKLMRTAYIR